MTYSAQIIVDYFLTHTQNPLTPMHMIKLTYIAHGYTLAILKKPLIKTHIEAWKYGPVIPVLYHTFKGYGNQEITNLNYCGTSKLDQSKGEKEFIESIIDKSSKDILDQVIELFSNWSALELSALTHQPGTPWDQCYIPEQQNTLIPNPIIQEFYTRKMKDGKSGH